MNTQNLNPTQDATLLLTQRVGSLWRCMLVNRQSGTPTIIETAEVNQDASLESLIESHEPDQIYVVLSGAQSVCRTTTLPDVDQDQIVEALRLQAEARFLGTTPSHRRVMAPLDSAVGETNRVGLIIAWPEQQTIEVPTCLDEACFIPDTVALAALLESSLPPVVGFCLSGSPSGRYAPPTRPPHPRCHSMDPKASVHRVDYRGYIACSKLPNPEPFRHSGVSR